jgi:deoxyribose-phosphate aldolase
MGYTFSGSEAVTLGADISASGSLLWWEKVSGIWQLNMNDLSGGIDYVNGTSGTVSTGATISGTTLTFAASKEMSRVRPSATIPTPEQIRKIYNDERPLYFVTGSQSTINGTSSAVTAMSSDPVTGLLQVGTSGGLSAFRGLQRVEQDTTAVTTTISANGATVARQ